MKKIIYIYNKKRAHKILPLIEGLPFILVKRLRDILRIKNKTDYNYLVLIDSFGRWGVLGITATLVLNAKLVVRLRGEIFKEQRELLIYSKGFYRWIRFFANFLIAKQCLKTAKMIIYNSNYWLCFRHKMKVGDRSNFKLAIIICYCFF